MITSQQMAWMAGIIDLRGRVYAKNNRNRNTPQQVLVVDSQNLSVVRRLCELTGTSSEAKNSRPVSEMFRRACIEHCPESHVHVYRDGLMMPLIARWTVTGSALVTVLYNLEPYLVAETYSDTVQEVMANLTLTGQGSPAVISSCLRLRKLGWELPARLEDAVEQRLELENEKATFNLAV